MQWNPIVEFDPQPRRCPEKGIPIWLQHQLVSSCPKYTELLWNKLREKQQCLVSTLATISRQKLATPVIFEVIANKKLPDVFYCCRCDENRSKRSSGPDKLGQKRAFHILAMQVSTSKGLGHHFFARTFYDEKLESLVSRKFTNYYIDVKLDALLTKRKQTRRF